MLKRSNGAQAEVSERRTDLKPPAPRVCVEQAMHYLDNAMVFALMHDTIKDEREQVLQDLWTTRQYLRGVMGGLPRAEEAA